MSKKISKEATNLIKEATKIRKLKGITQEEIALRTGLKQQQISRIETLKAMPTMETFMKYIKDINCEIKICNKTT